jgi:hypothetical protein
MGAASGGGLGRGQFQFLPGTDGGGLEIVHGHDLLDRGAMRLGDLQQDVAVFDHINGSLG